MHRYSWVAAFALFLTGSIPGFSSASPWGANYFPNVPLLTHEGETVRFFDDLIKDRIVVVNFIYTRCPDTCPLETA
ncbi:MAG: SCO family protein, partial [Pseudomonadota bacterium]